MIKGHERLNAVAGLLLAVVMLGMIIFEYSGSHTVAAIAGSVAVLVVLAFCFSVSIKEIIFVVIGVALIIWAMLTHDDWPAGLLKATETATFVIALYCALSALRSAAIGSPAIIECGRFLARQPPGRRYLALTLGGHLFGLILMYGSIALLGSLAVESTANETNPEIKRHRLRRMLVAIQRGFAATLCWSPLTFSMVITLALVPGATWGGVVLPCLVTTFLMIGVGWAMDTIFKPKLSGPPPTRPPETGSWFNYLRPLILLLAVVVSGTLILHVTTGVEVIGAVMTLVPAIALIWGYVQANPTLGPRGQQTARRAGEFLTEELPKYRGQIVLLFMAGFIGSLGAFVLVPAVQSTGLDLTVLPPQLIVVAMVWLVPFTGQIGMNPILAVSLLVPLLPSPEALGISPAAMVMAITGGWALSGTTSPFTASVLLVASFGKIPARDVGMKWNLAYVFVMGVLMSLWALLLTVIL